MVLGWPSVRCNQLSIGSLGVCSSDGPDLHLVMDFCIFSLFFKRFRQFWVASWVPLGAAQGPSWPQVSAKARLLKPLVQGSSNQYSPAPQVGFMLSLCGPLRADPWAPGLSGSPLGSLLGLPWGPACRVVGAAGDLSWPRGGAPETTGSGKLEPVLP